MLDFNDAANPAKVLSAHYSARVGDADLIQFMSGQSDIASKALAERIIAGFWQMTDLAIEDFQHNRQVEGIDDIEFWMHKLFNKVYGYMTLNDYQDEWDKAASQRNA